MPPTLVPFGHRGDDSLRLVGVLYQREVDLRRRADQARVSAVEWCGVAVLNGRRFGPDFDLYDAKKLRAARDLRGAFAVCNVPYKSFGERLPPAAG
jgi:hypothetical protein